MISLWPYGGGNIYDQRVRCWNDTVERSKQIPPPPKSIKVKHADRFRLSKHKRFAKSNIHFFDMDAIDCCLAHCPNALVLNLADDFYPGGCVDTGSGAQEESLFRRTNYHDTLKIEMYPICADQAIYSPGVTVLKTNESTGWRLLDAGDNGSRPKIAFIACPGIKYPRTVVRKMDGVVGSEPETRLTEKDAATLKMKIETIVQAAAYFGHDTVVLGALGCGAWRNPAKHVAEIFKEVLDEYDGVVLNYYFAILTTPNGDSAAQMPTTIDIFRRVFAV